MKRAQAQAAIDEAFADGLKNLFSVLVRADSSDADAIGRFENGVAEHRNAHAVASAVVVRNFPE